MKIPADCEEQVLTDLIRGIRGWRQLWNKITFIPQLKGHVLTPKFGKGSDLWVRLDKESVWWKEGYFSEIFGKEICGRLSAPVRQRNSRADFAGLDDDVAQSGETNGWIGDRA
jgi:hypothetical protein